MKKRKLMITLKSAQNIPIRSECKPQQQPKQVASQICILRLRHPRRHITLERTSAKESLHLSQEVKQLYESPVLDDSNSAIGLYRTTCTHVHTNPSTHIQKPTHPCKHTHYHKSSSHCEYRVNEGNIELV